jgi:hypothetical protein
MYDTVPDKNVEHHMMSMSLEHMKDIVAWSDSMHSAVVYWPNSMDNFLSNQSVNHMAHIGQCGVMWCMGVPAYIVKRCWSKLTHIEKLKANNEAKNAFRLWRKIKSKELCQGLGKQMLF